MTRSSETAPPRGTARGATERDRQKADRYLALVQHATRLFAERGFSGVSLEDIGAAVGVSGPAVYRHFANKQALLGAILEGASERLLTGGRRVVESSPDPDAALRGLIDFHVDFALAEADVIRVQDRDLASLVDTDRRTVRRLQRDYVGLWVGVLARLQPEGNVAELTVRAHATFGLINSTPHSLHALGDGPRGAGVRDLLAAMASAAIRV